MAYDLAFKNNWVWSAQSRATDMPRKTATIDVHHLQPRYYDSKNLFRLRTTGSRKAMLTCADEVIAKPMMSKFCHDQSQ